MAGIGHCLYKREKEHREIQIKQFPIVTTHWWPKTRNERFVWENEQYLYRFLPLVHNHVQVIWVRFQISTSHISFLKGEREVVCGQVWWPILRICALHLTHPSVHTHSSEHTPGAVGSQCCGARGAVGGSVPCSRDSPQSWYWRRREYWLFTPPPTIPAGPETRTHDLRVTSPTLYPLGHDCPLK